MGKKEVVTVLLLLAFAVALDHLAYTGQPVRNSKYYFISPQERESFTFDPRWNRVRLRAEQVKDQEPERYLWLFNYTLVEIFVSDLFEPTGRHPRPTYYPFLKRWEREGEGLLVGKDCIRRDGRKGRWNVNINDLWICE